MDTIESLNFPMFIRTRIAWVSGSLEKLVNLGMLEVVDEEFNYSIPDISYNDLDNNRDVIEDNDIHKTLELLVLIGEMSLDDKAISSIGDLLVDYKNRRNEILVYCYNCMLKE